MKRAAAASHGESPSGGGAHAEPAVRLRLYVARSTPNSIRAEHNLSMVLDELESSLPRPALEVVDVFSQPKRAITDGVVVTPTLIGLGPNKRVLLMGDLADRLHLTSVLRDLLA